MRALVVIALMLALGGCESRGEKAEKAYRAISGNGDYEMGCTAARHAQQVYLEEGNGAKAQEMKRRADGECATVQVHNVARGRR